MKYTYSFSVWPDETKYFGSAIFQLFAAGLSTRVEMDFTEGEFTDFRARILRHGLTLREIERSPYQKPETIL